MKIKVNKSQFEISYGMMQEYYRAGYRYYCDGDYYTTQGIDPWSGMPEVGSNTYFFDNKAEAEAFAITQRWVFNPEMHAEVYQIGAN